MPGVIKLLLVGIGGLFFCPRMTKNRPRLPSVLLGVLIYYLLKPLVSLALPVFYDMLATPKGTKSIPRQNPETLGITGLKGIYYTQFSYSKGFAHDFLLLRVKFL